MSPPPKRPTPTPLESFAPVSISSVPMSKEMPTATRRRSLEVEEVPGAWLDKLLVATIELPVSEGEEAVVRAMLKALSEILPACGVGACLVTPNEARKSTPDLAKGEQSVWKITPHGEDHRAVGMDPTRLFPGYAYELSIEAEPDGSSLHVAGDDEGMADGNSPVRLVLSRAAQGMGRGLIFARVHKKAMTDSQNLRALNDHMVQAEKLASLGQIAAGVVHELNNPLTSIVAYTDLLLRKMNKEPSSDPSDVERLRRIGESATRMLRFTRDLVTYARPSAQKPEPFRVESVIERALAFCEHVLGEAGATVERKLEPVPVVSGMPEQLAQVFVNLFTNAVHAMPPTDGKLTVGTHLNGADVIVTVEDNGHGIQPDHFQSIFAPFFTTKTEGRGTGLGLSIVKNIVEAHDGEIWAEPKLDGCGARFVIVLRAAK